jgi:hypothetical protein
MTDSERARIHAEVDCIILYLCVKRGPPLTTYDPRAAVLVYIRIDREHVE